MQPLRTGETLLSSELGDGIEHEVQVSAKLPGSLVVLDDELVLWLQLCVGCVCVVFVEFRWSRGG